MPKLGENAENSTNVTVGIITVLTDFELPAVKRAFGIEPMSTSKPVGDRDYWFAKIGSEESTMNIAITVTDGQGNDKARTATGNLIKEFDPMIVMLIGIAAGIKDRVSLGDIVVSSAVYFYEPAKLTQNGTQHRPRVEKPSKSIMRYFRTFSNRPLHSDWHGAFHIAEGKLKSEDFPDPPKCLHPRPYIGMIASGEKIFADDSLKKMQGVEHGDIFAGETEGWGFAQAAIEAQKDWIVIRGISDLGDPETKDGIDKDRYHHSAANAAATYARTFLEKTDFKGKPKSKVSGVGKNIDIPESINPKLKPEEPVETPIDRPNAIEKQNVQVDVRKEQVALAVSAIIFHETRNPPEILFCYSEKQKKFILPGGHFYKMLEKTNEKVPAWYVDPNARPSTFLLEEKLKDKYEIKASLDTDFHAQSAYFHMANIETPFLLLAERPSVGEGHEWHYDFYYMCKKESPKDSYYEVDDREKKWLVDTYYEFADREKKWLSLEEIQQLVNNNKIFDNLEDVMKEAMNKKKAKKPITDKRGEKVKGK